MSEEAEIIPLIIRSLGIRSFELFGHSVGGAMALVCTSVIPDCRSVVTESAQAFVEQRTLDGISMAKKNFEDPKNFARLTKYHGRKASWVLRAWTEVWLSSEFVSWSLASVLPEVRCPVLALHGDSDEYGSTAFPRMIRDLAGSGSAEMVILPQCGHVPHREKPEVILNLLREFYSITRW